MNLENVIFKALVVRQTDSGLFHRSIEQRRVEDLPVGDVLVSVQYSSLNYKDALSASGNRGVTKKFPHTPGVDAAGVIAWSRDPAFQPGMEVVVSGYDLGMNTSGGFGQYIRVPSGWVLPKPDILTLLQSMQIGTAGFTAAQCVSAIIESGVESAAGPVLVTGATGGVGSIAIALLSQCGYRVIAVTGKESEYPFLKKLGAEDCLSRKQLSLGSDRLLLRERWAGIVDSVGGAMLASAIKATQYGGTVTCCGNAMSGDLPINVYPFILRAVRLIGIDSAQCPMERRKRIWEKLAGSWKIPLLDEMSRTVTLNELDASIQQMLRGGSRGRVIIDLQEDA